MSISGKKKYLSWPSINALEGTVAAERTITLNLDYLHLRSGRPCTVIATTDFSTVTPVPIRAHVTNHRDLPQVVDGGHVVRVTGVDGGWSVWGDWKWGNECSKSCNGGKRTRYKTRSCTNPTPMYAGKQCVGEPYQIMTTDCNTQDCPDLSRENHNLKRLMDALFSDEFSACKDISYSVIEHPTDCTKFIRCRGGKHYVDSCHEGSYWDQSKFSCQPGTC
ncbi:hypothetical protein CHS0354_016054 [Potamilus streckersoni]|uniref:Chitin-binding type-2 domain-containing protein n=1 Tax=Potamilus streckersoni TaxID=2493646 RepID=A0AAE0W4Y3_9BIVA|nr:hypothetical protein CHS0354_016054 [Potamilus streckersoni]